MQWFVAVEDGQWRSGVSEGMENDLFEDNLDVFGSDQFIVLSSQDDSHSAFTLDLHGLQQPLQGEEESRDSEVVYPLMETSAAPSGSLVLVTDTEVEAAEKPGVSSDGCVIGETSEDNQEQVGSATSSDDAANVTVIAREGEGQGELDDPLSQDLFAAKEDDQEEARPVSTPSHHLASLQLSGQPMLVPETLEDSLGDQEICPSPEAYGDMPHIIPSTPSLTADTQGAEADYNPEEEQTLNSHPGRAMRRSSPELQSQSVSQRQASVGASASVGSGGGGEGVMGPTMAGDIPEWQQSQSLCLLLTSSSSTAPSQPQGRQAGSQQRMESQSAFQSQGGKSDLFAMSQNPQMDPDLSENSAPQKISDAFSLPVPKPASESQRQKAAEKVEMEIATSSSSRESSAGVSLGTTARAVISIDMVHSQSQSASETIFKLERPEVGAGDKTAETEEVSGSQNIFYRTRQQSKRIAAAKQTPSLSEDSEDIFGNIGKTAAEVPALSVSVSYSDPIPCSQNRPAPRGPPLKQEERMDTGGEEDSQPPATLPDIYNLDTVMDSEPEDEGTQSYDVFPALSRNTSQSSAVRPTAAEEMEEAQVPELLPSISAVSPSPPKEPPATPSLPVHPPSQPTSQPQHVSQRASQVAARLAQLSARNEQTTTTTANTPQPSAAPPRTSSQPARGTSQPIGLCRPASQPIGQSRSASQRIRSQRGVDKSGRDVLGSVSVEMARFGRLVSGDRPAKDGGTSPSGRKGETTVAGGGGRQATLDPDPDPDPYAFCSSQSQLVVEADIASTSRAETSVSTARMLKTKPKGFLGRRRKVLVKKKKSEVNLRGGMKSSSTDDGTGSKPALRTAKKARKGEKFTRLQKAATEDFKIPEPSALGSSRGKDHAETATEADLTTPLSVQQQPTLRIAQGEKFEPKPSTSRSREETAGGAGDSQDSQKMRKRKSVEFGGVVQIDSPPLPLSLEQSLSDSQSSDTLLEVTQVTEFIMRLVKRRIVVQKIDKDGNIVHQKMSMEEKEPVLVEERSHTSKRRVSCVSPQGSGSTLESGDLADISSSSLSNKASLGHSSLERGISSLGHSSLELPPPAPLSSAIPLEVAAGSGTANASSTSMTHTSVPWRLSGGQSAPPSFIETRAAPMGEHSLGGRSSTGVSPAISFISPDQSAIERDDSRLEAVVTSSCSGLASEALYSADNKQSSSSDNKQLSSSDLPCAQPQLKTPQQAASSSSSSLSSSGLVPPTAEESSSSKQQSGTMTRSVRKATRRAAADSSQEENRQSSKVTSSPPESQSFQPGTESGGFTVVMSGARKKSQSSGTPGTSPVKAGAVGTSSSKKSSVRQQSSQETSERDNLLLSVQTASKLEIGARVMCRWKDGFFYPAKFIGLNTGIGNNGVVLSSQGSGVVGRFKVLFEDGMEKMVRAIDLVMAQNLPLGQSVLVTGDDGVSDPGIVIKHVPSDSPIAERGEAVYDVAMDDGSTRRCRRSQLILSEDQASCLLSDEEYRASLGETDLSLVNTADVSLDNVIQGKRLRTKGSPAVGVPRILTKPSTSTAPSDPDDTATTKRKASSSQSGQGLREVQTTPVSTRTLGPMASTSTSKDSSRKRKPTSVSTSTPIPKQMKTSERHRTPRKALQESASPLGGAVASPENQKRPTRKARIGLFENVKGPMPTSPSLFRGLNFLLTHVDKPPDVVAEEKRQLHTSSLDTSNEESADDGSDMAVISFDKDHLLAQIEAGGGSVLSKFPPSLAGAGKKLFLISDTFHRTVKYLQCLAGNVPAVSHTWITHSCTQNKLLDYKSYVLPAGISFEKHAILERCPNVSCLVGQRVLLTSSVAGFLEAWTSILELVQCRILSKFAANATINRPGVDVVVTDHTCVGSMEERARQLGVPLVCSEWLVQCLINNARPPHHAHPRYCHTFFRPSATTTAAAATTTTTNSSQDTN
ncbi:hypothetical protein ACOMHN_048841 [Nucella lapillus]